MVTLRSTRSEKFWVGGEDEYGRRRVVVAEKAPDDFNWKLRYQHPNFNQEATYSSRHGLLDALNELFAKHDAAFVQSRENGDRPRQVMATDRNRNVDGFIADIVPLVPPRY